MKTRIGKVLFLCFALLLFSCSGGHDNPAPAPQPISVTGSATLYWNPVTTYTDGSAIDLSGYKIYCGTSHNTYTKTITLGVDDLASANAPTYTIGDLPQGTYYFSVSACDITGTEGALSQEVHKTI